MTTEALGKIYHDGDVIVRQGEMGECMFIIQDGVAEVLQRKEDKEYCLAVLSEGECFGEMALFEKEVRSATVRARGDVRVLTVDKRLFLRRVHEDPSLAFNILQKMSHRIRELNGALNKSMGRRSALR
jgi:CRP-like cAMP-binding protein